MQQSRGAAAENCAAMEDTGRAAPTHADGALARERDDAARDCDCDGVSLSTVNRAHMAYDHGGIKALKPKPNGGRKHENMTLAEEKALLARFAKAAGAGEMLNIHDLKAAYEKAIGHATSDSTVYNLLQRHGWRKLMPRPFHPKRDLAAQNAFKKTAFLML
jgi:transposase